MRVTHRDEPAPPPKARGRGSFDEALERTAAPAASAGQRPLTPALPEVREAARAVPPIVWSGRLAREQAVELSFGRDLSVELRQAPGGVELAIRASPALVRAAAVDLPALVAALREHGVNVVRAGVRGAPAGGGATPRRRASR